MLQERHRSSVIPPIEGELPRQEADLGVEIRETHPPRITASDTRASGPMARAARSPSSSTRRACARLPTDRYTPLAYAYVSASTSPSGRRSALYRTSLDGQTRFARCQNRLPWFDDNIDAACVTIG